MISDSRCFDCLSTAFDKLIDQSDLTNEQKNDFSNRMTATYAQSKADISAPALARELHSILRSYTQQADPYKQVKQQSNDLVLKMYPEFKKRVLNSDNPFDMALRLAIAGNIIDFAVSSQFDLNGTIDHVLSSNFAINHGTELRDAIRSAQSILYLGDNCGEMVFDKLFIETIMHPHLRFAVRGAPAINDATMEDAHDVNMHLVADVISNGYDAPSTLLDHCSNEFLEAFHQADVIISKGQGNLEGLLGNTKKRVFFLLMVKCDVMAQALKVKKGDFVVIDNWSLDKNIKTDDLTTILK